MRERLAIPINDDGAHTAAMADPKVRDFIFETLEGFDRFAVEIRPWIMISIVMSLVLDHAVNPQESFRELSAHMDKSIAQAMARRSDALARWQLDPRHQNG